MAQSFDLAQLQSLYLNGSNDYWFTDFFCGIKDEKQDAIYYTVLIVGYLSFLTLQSTF